MTTPDLIRETAGLAVAAILYAITITVVAMTAIATANAEQRRAALKVLALLLRKDNEPNASAQPERRL